MAKPVFAKTQSNVVQSYLSEGSTVGGLLHVCSLARTRCPCTLTLRAM